MTKKVNSDKITQIQKGKDCYLVFMKDNSSVKLRKSGKLDYAFDFGNWSIFESAIKDAK